MIIRLLFIVSIVLPYPVIIQDNDNGGGITEHKIILNDSVSYLLYEKVDSNNNTLCYWAEIETEVCRERTCEIAYITIYWDEIGDFLKYTLPKGRDLTKHDHKPFTFDDYEKLTKILADSNSLIKNYTFEKINDVVENSRNEVDAITGATPGELANSVVRGAAFSTYTFWHIVYGAPRDTILHLLEKKANINFILEKLDSGQPNIKLWAIKEAKKKFKSNKPLQDKILTLISDKNLDVAAESLRFFTDGELETQLIQHAVVNQFIEVDPVMKYEILYRLKRLDKIYNEIFTFLLNEFLEDRIGISAYTQIMQMAKSVEEPSAQVIFMVDRLLSHENFYVSRKAYDYLKNYPSGNRQLEKSLKKFEKKYSDRLY